MGRAYKPTTLAALADEAVQFSNSHFRNGERRTADLLWRVAKALRFAAQALESRRAETTGSAGESADEASILRDIAFSVAMIDPDSNSEHDMLLFEVAHERATEWHRRFREKASG